MRDANGREVRLKDRVKLWENHFEKIVLSIDTGEFIDRYPREEWSHLKMGVLIETDTGDLFYYDEPDEDFEVVR